MIATVVVFKTLEPELKDGLKTKWRYVLFSKQKAMKRNKTRKKERPNLFLYLKSLLQKGLENMYIWIHPARMV